MSEATLITPCPYEAYEYNDCKDKLTRRMVDKDPKNWDIPEKRLFDQLKLFIIESNGTENLAELELLDAGCGPKLRNCIRLSQIFGGISACEPDTQRFREALRAAQTNKNLRNKTEVLNCGLEELRRLSTKSFDCIVLSHVINHIPSQKGEQLIKCAFSLLKPGGFFYLTTAHSQTAIDTFHVDTVGEVSKPVFEESILQGKHCTHRYSSATLLKSVRGIGFEVPHWVTMNYLDYPDLEAKLNMTDMKARFGVNLGIIAKKPQ